MKDTPTVMKTYLNLNLSDAGAVSIVSVSRPPVHRSEFRQVSFSPIAAWAAAEFAGGLQ
jgi:hypothetical protein